MKSYTCRAIVACLVGFLSGCGGGGSGGSDDAPQVVFSVDHMTLTGQASWPGATTVAVTIDGAPEVVINGAWTHSIDLAHDEQKTVRVAVIADGVTVAMRDVTVKR